MLLLSLCVKAFAVDEYHRVSDASPYILNPFLHPAELGLNGVFLGQQCICKRGLFKCFLLPRKEYLSLRGRLDTEQAAYVPTSLGNPHYMFSNAGIAARRLNA